MEQRDRVLECLTELAPQGYEVSKAVKAEEKWMTLACRAPLTAV